ncbi:hypothetical protein M3Y98_00242900 [Aphelenchoides besseyi]|nr:hypothetical protein M3Y98_00242900 [Aphelenchoides besseyi]
MSHWMMWPLWFALATVATCAEQRTSDLSSGPSASIVDVRGLIKDALDVMRSYPAPKELIQPTQMNPLVQAQYQQQPMTMAQPSAYPRHAYGSTTYNGGVISEVDRRFGAAADSQTNIAQQFSRFFATPSNQDMERLFHLPADIVTRLATDAGYIKPGEEPASKYESSVSSSSSAASPSAFDFTLTGHDTNAKDLQSFIASLQNHSIETSTAPPPAPVISVAGPPKITTQQVLRDGKMVAVPLLIIPQANGPALQVPFNDMRDLSDTVNRIISTGQFQIKTTALPTVKPMTTVVPIPDNVQVEPTTRKPSSISVGSNDGAFVQQFEEESSAEDAEAPQSNQQCKQQRNVQHKRRLLKSYSMVEDISLLPLNPLKKPQHKKPKTTKEIKTTTTPLPTTNSRSFHVEETSVVDTSSNEDHSAALRAPTLRELEERYNRENALATRGGSAGEPEESAINESDETDDRFSRRGTRLLALRTPLSIKKPKPGETIKTHTPNNSRCGILRAFAHKFGVGDLRSFALEHCDFLERYDPVLKCADVNSFISNCESEFVH